jgi:hypothetical protein
MEPSFTYAQLIETLLAVVGIIIITRGVIVRTTPSELSAPSSSSLSGNLNRILVATFILLAGLLAINIIASLTINRDKTGDILQGCGDQNTLNTTITGNSIPCIPRNVKP